MEGREKTPDPDACEREVRSLHGFFADWYTGSLDEDSFDRLEDTLAPGFEMVTPDGDVLTRDDTVGYVRDRYDTHEDFEIEIRSVETVEAQTGLTILRYEEWQTTGDDKEGTTEGTEKNGRLSTGVFGVSEKTPEGIEWLYLQETWL